MRGRIDREGVTTTRLPSERLTHREHEILLMYAAGYVLREIAAELVVSPHTVTTHRRNLITRLGARTLTQALAIAVRRGWVTATDLHADGGCIPPERSL